MAREKITVSPEFKQAVAGYQTRRGLRSWSQALVELARLGYKTATGDDAPKASRDYGRPLLKRRKEPRDVAG